MFDLSKTRSWMYRNARPLDLARWRMLFEGGPKRDVLEAMKAYQNPDGGFGNAIEPDNLNPYSTPYATSFAATILCMMDLETEEEAAPLTAGILRYFESGEGFVNGRWQFAMPANNDYPHAPWCGYSPDAPTTNLFPSASIAGYALTHAREDSPLYARALGVAREACASLLAGAQTDMHEGPDLIFLLMSLQRCSAGAEFDLPALWGILNGQLLALVERDPEKWTDYVCKPTLVVQSPQSPLYAELAGPLEKELDLLETTCEDGSWPINWRWGSHEREFAISELRWKGFWAVNNAMLLAAFGRLG